MEKMQEKEFDDIPQKNSVEECKEHEVVKLYYLGTHSDYGCKKCKLKSLDLNVFKKNSN